MKTILLTNHYEEGPLRIISKIIPPGFQLQMLPETKQEELEKMIPQADYLLASGRLKIDKKVLDNATKLKMIQRTGVGLDSLDLCEIKKRGIPLYVNQGVNAQSVAEHTILLCLACLRKLCVISDNTKAGIWKKQEQGVQTYELANKRIGLIGMGNIASKVALILKAFGCEVYYYDPYRKDSDSENELGIVYKSLEELMAISDLISLHCPLTEETYHLINRHNIDTLKTGAILINTARGGLVEEQALIQALESGKIAFAGLDVFEQEPLTESELMKLENVILTPHIGGITSDSFEKMMRDAVRNIVLFDSGKKDEIQEYMYNFGE